MYVWSTINIRDLEVNKRIEVGSKFINDLQITCV